MPTFEFPIVPRQRCMIYDHRYDAESNVRGWVEGTLHEISLTENGTITYKAKADGQPFLYLKENEIKPRENLENS